jgi:protein involved in sex pheromone biosynthesis
MKKAIYTVFIAGILAISACSKEEQQQTAKDISHKEELEKAEKVQGIVDDKTAKDSNQTKDETDK